MRITNPSWRRSLYGALFGAIVFLILNTAVWSGAFAPKGAVSLFFLRNDDSAQYLTYLALARDRFLFPNLHMPWLAEPALFHPLFLTAGRIGGWLGMTPVAILMAMEAMMVISAGVALVWVLYVF